MRIELPKKMRETISFEGRDEYGPQVLEVTKIQAGVYFAKIVGAKLHARWGDATQIREDVEHFLTFGTLPMGKRIW